MTSTASVSPKNIVCLALFAAMALGGCTRAPSQSETSTTTTDSNSNSSSDSSTETDTSTGSTDTHESLDGDWSEQPDWVISCDPWIQDCLEGEKCVPYSTDGEIVDDTMCVPILGTQEPGEPCTYGGIVDATDNCDASGLCFYVEEIDGMLSGTCLAFCGGAIESPICSPGTGCLISNHGSITLCLTSCHPLAQDCDQGQVCAGAGEFLCRPGPAEGGAPGESCDVDGACQLGSTCIAADLVPGCEFDSCCTEYCDSSDPNFVCSNPQASCVPFFAMNPPLGDENVGWCGS